MWGPSPVQTPGHKEYYVSFTDDYTRWTHLELLASKDKTFEAYKNFEMWAKVQFGLPTFKALLSNRGGEYLGSEFSKHLKSQGMERKLMTHDTPEYNGVSERLNWIFWKGQGHFCTQGCLVEKWNSNVCFT